MLHDSPKIFFATVNGIDAEFFAYVGWMEVERRIIVGNDLRNVHFKLPLMQTIIQISEGVENEELIDQAIHLFKEHGWPRRLFDSGKEDKQFFDDSFS